MKKSKKFGLVKSLSSVLVLILALALTLTGCADKTAQQMAEEAKTAASNAQQSADNASTAAGNAQQKADKAENDAKNNAEAIAKLPDTEAVAAAIKDILNEYVKGTELKTDSIVTTEEIKDFLTSEQTATKIAEALVGYAKTEDVLKLAEGYATKEALETLKTELNNAVASKLNDYITDAAAKATYATKEELTAAVTNATKQITALGERVTALEALVSGEEGGLDAIIAKVAQGLVDANNKTFTETTEVVIVKLEELDKEFAKYNPVNYAAEEYNNLVKAYNNARVRLLRAINAEEANKVFDDVKTELAEVDDLADTAYVKVDEIVKPIIIAALTNVENKDADSKESIDEAIAAVNAAIAVMGEDAVKKYNNGEKTVDLVKMVEDAEAVYANLVAAKDAAPAVQEAINALIPAVEVYTAYTDNDDILALKANLEQAAATFKAWTGKYFADDAGNVNIDRLVDMTGYNAALNYCTEILYGTALANWRAQIREALFNAKYIDSKDEGYNVNGTCLYSTLEALTAVKNTVDTEAAALTVETSTIGQEYTDLKNAIEYATKMTAKKTEAEKEGGLIEQIVALGDADLLAWNNNAVATVKAAYDAWVEGVDTENEKAILGDNVTALNKAVDRMAVLANAKTAADELNAQIKAYTVETVKITDKAALEALKTSVNTWLTTYAIVADATDAKYVEANYELVAHDTLAELIAACKDKTVDAIADAAANVLPKINAIDTTGKILYQKKNITEAEQALSDWLTANGLVNISDIDATGLEGETAEQYEALVKAVHTLEDTISRYDSTLAAAKAQYESDKVKYDLFNVLTAYALKNGETIKNAYNTAASWFNTYADADLGGIEGLEELGVETGFTSAQYNKIVDAKAAYDKTLAIATTDAKAIKALIDLCTPVNIYSRVDIVNAKTAYEKWCKDYNVEYADYSSDAFESTLKDMKNVIDTIETELEPKIDKIEKEKKEETDKVNDLLAALNKSIVLADEEAVKAARAAYDKWLNGDGKATMAIDATKTVKIDGKDYYIVSAENYKYLTDAEAYIEKLKNAKEAAQNAIKALDKLAAPVAGMDQAVITAYKAALDDAKAKVTAFHDLGTDRLDNSYLTLVTKGEYHYARYETTYQIQKDYKQAVLDHETDANYEAQLKGAIDSVLNDYLDKAYAESTRTAYYTDNTVFTTLYTEYKAALQKAIADNSSAK